MPPQGARPPATSYTRPAPSRGKRVERAGRVARCLRTRVPMGGTRNRERPCHAASSVPHSPRHQMPPQGASHLLRARVLRIVRFRWPLPGSVPCGRLGGPGGARREHCAGQGIVAGLSRAQPGQEGGTSRHQIWPETGLRAGTQAVHARHQRAASSSGRACARSDRRQSREVRAVGRGRAQCDGLSEDGCAPARKPCLGRWTRPVEWWDVACGCSPPICSILRQDGRVLTIKIYLKICGRPSKFADQNLRWPGSKPVLWPTLATTALLCTKPYSLQIRRC